MRVVVYILFVAIIIFLSLGINSCLVDQCEERGGQVVSRGYEFTGCIEPGRNE